MKDDKTIHYLLELHGTTYVVDENLGLWVKFEARLTENSNVRPHGIRYSLSLHNRFNERIMGFDNAHGIEIGKKKNINSQNTHDHWHRNENDHGQPYHFKSAGELLTDFWKEVEKIIKNLEGN